MNKKYVIKIGKMYIQSLYIKEDCINTDFIEEIDFVTDKKRAYYILNECEANIIVDKLIKIFRFYNLQDLIEIEEVEDEERE